MRRNSLRETAWILYRSFLAAPGAFLLSHLESAGYVCIPLRYYFLGGVLDEALTQGRDRVWWWLVALTVNEVVGLAGGQIGSAARIRLGESVGNWIDAQVAAAFAEIPTVDFHFDPDFLDRTNILRRGAGEFGRGVSQLFQGLAVMAGFTSLVLVIVGTTPEMFLLVAVSFLPMVRASWTNRLQIRCEEGASGLLRRAQALRSVLSSDSGSSELGAAGSRRWCSGRMTELIRSWAAQRRRKDSLVSLLVALETLLTFAAVLAVVHGLSTGLARGELRAGQAVQTLLLVQQVMNVGRTFQMLQRVWSESFTTLGRLAWLRRYAESYRNTPSPCHDNAVSIRNVSFVYPGSPTPALDDVSLELHPGSTTVIMGENGSGKSTLASILLGALTPTRGEVSSPTGQSHRSVVQQAFNRFEFTVRDTVSLGHADERTGDLRLGQSLAAARADQFVSGLPAGTETQLGATWTSGVGLSSGQWQRLAIARGLFPSGTKVIVLDEPSSALDAHAERELLASIGQSKDAVRVVITHRMSSVPEAGQIVVMGAGRIVERGTHSELLECNGLYAQMFAAQARDYADMNNVTERSGTCKGSG